MCVIQGMYSNARIHAWVNGQYNKEFVVRVGVHRGSVLCPLLFILVLEALSHEFLTGVPWELLYTDDLVLIADTQEECYSKIRLGGVGGFSKVVATLNHVGGPFNLFMATTGDV